MNIDHLKLIINKAKGNICKDFEKVCPTDKSFERVKKDLHDTFDELQKNLLEVNINE